MLCNLKAEMARKNILFKDLAKVLKITDKSVANKINGVTEFNRREMFILKKTLFPDLQIEYLFADTPDRSLAG